MISNKRLVEQYLSDLLKVYNIKDFEELKKLDDQSIGAELKDVYNQFLGKQESELLDLVNSNQFKMLGEKHYQLKSDLKTSYDSKQRFDDIWSYNGRRFAAFFFVPPIVTFAICIGLLLFGVTSVFLGSLLPISIMTIIMFVPMIIVSVYSIRKESKSIDCEQKLKLFEDNPEPSEYCKKLRKAIEKNATSLPAVVSPTVPTGAESQEPVNDATLAARPVVE